jgi:2-polyprenyl-3-methyl-5-hydroxy-6-metoxy-1,4-benzoquinol methylase|tara:strand:+ start:119 stop:982 length:864 start_codon:yes stop_codon:yes gene_type:complete
VLLSVFNKEEIDIFMQDNLLSCVSSCYRFKFRLVPIEDLLIVSSPPENIKLPGYVHVGYDSFSLWKLIKKEFKAEKIQDVLEIGCGAGFLSLWISRFAKSITATDISRNAIDLANLNVKINRIDNITTLTSDVYSNVNGKYDIIISNPPFEFLPSNDKKLLHSYGGQLGIEITMKILSGLEKHLKEQGTTYILANSYIEKSGCNTLIHEIEKLFKGTGFDITMREFTYQLRPDLLGFYKKHDISHSISYLIQIKRTGNFNLKVIPLHGFSRLKENLRLKMLPLSAKT